MYLCDQVDVAGFVEINIKRFAFDLCTDKQAVEKALREIQGKFIISPDGKTGFLKNFIKHQKNYPFNENNPAHKGILTRLEANRHLFEYDNISMFFLGASDPLGRGIGKGTGNDGGREEKGGVGEKEGKGEKTNYEKFLEWIKDNTPYVARIARQPSENEFNLLKEKFPTSRITDLLMRMDNYKGCEKKYTSVYRTLLNWAKKDG
jgi:hypothetical protein